MQIEKKPIKINYVVGRYGYNPEAIVIHLMGGTFEGTDSWFRNPESQASTHYGVAKDGRVRQWVEEKDMAWGNGRVDHPKWKGLKPGNPAPNPNLYTVSIEHEGVTGHKWTDQQYASLVALVRQIAQRWNIPLDSDHIVLHSEIYSLKPNCPGAGFDRAKFLSMVKPEVIDLRSSLVKGDKTPAIYWVDQKNIAHGIPSMPFLAEYFGSVFKTYPQAQIDALQKGATFKI